MLYLGNPHQQIAAAIRELLDQDYAIGWYNDKDS
jgi:hypothetical protein